MERAEPSWTIDVLGALVIRRHGELLPPLTSLQAAVLTCLALAGRKGMKTHELLDAVIPPEGGGRAISSKSALHKHFEALRKLGWPIPPFGSLVTDAYALDMERVRVDAAEFIGGVRELPAEPTEAQVAELIGYWREDPKRAHPRIRPGRWRRVFQARATLLKRIESAALVDTVGLEDFVALFPGDPECAPLSDRLARRERKLLLVVEDDVLDQVTDALDEYDHVPVGSLEEWDRLLKTDRDRVLRCHGALVDLHLTDGFDDEQGFDIVEWLRDNTEIPTALMTVAPPWDDYDREPRVHRDRYRLVKIVNKQNRQNGRLNRQAIRTAVKSLTSDEDEDVRIRLETWLDSAFFHAARRLRRVRNADGLRRLKECERSAEATRRSVRSGTLRQAEDAVREFVRAWTKPS
ncbi:hypothetical protein [Spirillospora sp. NPDC029432]|uniref:hypothetical protein n=1 Tax=Spirillospora sp. NPDC029432 TaxID=3154599 RepID=UPI00345487B4